MTTTVEALLTPDEVADIFRVSPETLRKWRATGTGPRSRKVGRHVRYRPEDVARWIAAH